MGSESNDDSRRFPSEGKRRGGKTRTGSRTCGRFDVKGDRRRVVGKLQDLPRDVCLDSVDIKGIGSLPPIGRQQICHLGVHIRAVVGQGLDDEVARAVVNGHDPRPARRTFPFGNGDEEIARGGGIGQFKVAPIGTFDHTNVGESRNSRGRGWRAGRGKRGRERGRLRDRERGGITRCHLRSPIRQCDSH
jgi:hypothetical protein